MGQAVRSGILASLCVRESGIFVPEMPDDSSRKSGLSDGSPDAELIAGVRGGDEHAYDLLYRRHSESALRYARSLAKSTVDAEDVVAEAFARVLAALQAGMGPEEAFRPYLLSVVRNA